MLEVFPLQFFITVAFGVTYSKGNSFLFLFFWSVDVPV